MGKITTQEIDYCYINQIVLAQEEYIDYTKIPITKYRIRMTLNYIAKFNREEVTRSGENFIILEKDTPITMAEEKQAFIDKVDECVAKVKKSVSDYPPSPIVKLLRTTPLPIIKESNA